MRIRILIFLAAVLLLPLALLLPRNASYAAPAGSGTGVCGLPVLRVVDGDTIVVKFKEKNEKIRLLNVDTPESVHPDRRQNTPMGKAASGYTRARLSGKTICLEFEKKKRGNYGRLLAYVILDGQNFNIELVRQGWSPYYTKYGTSFRFHKNFVAAQKKARSGHRQIWAGKTPSPSAHLQTRHISPAPLACAGDHPGPFKGNTRSRVFHGPSCRWYGCKHCTRIFSTRKAAVAAGFRPCGHCRP